MWSADTDVLIHLLDLVSHANLEAQTRLKFLTGKGKVMWLSEQKLLAPTNVKDLLVCTTSVVLIGEESSWASPRRPELPPT